MDPNVASGGPRRRNRGSRAGSASRPPSGADPDAASVGPRPPPRNRGNPGGSASRTPDAAHPNASAGRREPTPRECLRFIAQMSGRRRGDRRALFPIPVPFFLRDRLPGRQIWNNNQLDMALEFTDLLLRQFSQASDSTAPPSLHPGAEGSGRRRVRQSVLYSNRPRRPQRRFSATEEHPSEVSSSELDGAVTGFPRLDDLSFSDASHLTPQIAGEETAAADDATEEHPRQVSSSELGGVVTDLPTLDELSFSDAPHLEPQMTGEETDDDDASSHLYRSGHVGVSFGPTGVTKSMRQSRGSPFSEIVQDKFWERLARKSDPDVDLEKLKRAKEVIGSQPRVSIEEAFERLVANEYKTLTALAAERGVEPPRNPFLVDQEAPSLEAQQEDPAAAPYPQDCMAVSHEATIQDGKEWMRDEVTLCFRKHIEKTPYLAGVVFELDELCHQCFNVENYLKVFHHYNFKMRVKMPASVEWTKELYFGEVKEIFGKKFYFCCRLEPDESGDCYACKNQGVEDLKHPVTGGFEIGWPNATWNSDGDE